MTEAEAEAAGFLLEDYDDDDPIEVWPENLAAVNAFQGIGTRWCYGGMGGITGVRWEAVYPLLDRMGLSHKEYDALLSDMEVMEGAALTAINAKR